MGNVIMMKFTPIAICLFVWLFLIVSCGISGLGGAYLSHISNVQSILEKNSGDPQTAMEKAIAYMENNEEKIRKVSTQLKELTPEETEKVYLQILRAQKSFEEYIKNQPTEDNPFGAHESFVKAILPLFQ
jgi:hypothetical protein